jgi:hypothetical protein
MKALARQLRRSGRELAHAGTGAERVSLTGRTGGAGVGAAEGEVGVADEAEC